MLPLVYDCEIEFAIPSGERIEGIEYCSGWNDYEGMGISVVGYKLGEDEIEYSRSAAGFMDYLILLDNEEIEHCLVGFNSKGFDDRLLEANGLEGITTHYDVLEEIRIAAGFTAHFSSVPKGYSYRLDLIAKANGMAKTGSGELAPILWQQGQAQKVIDYCKMDVEITKKILDLGLAGELIDPNTKRKLKLRSLGLTSRRNSHNKPR